MRKEKVDYFCAPLETASQTQSGKQEEKGEKKIKIRNTKEAVMPTTYKSSLKILMTNNTEEYCSLC